MSSGIVALMLGVSTFLGALALLGLIWGLKTGQFDDHRKFINNQYDSEDALKDAILMEKKQKAARRKQEALKREKNYRPPD